MGKNKVPGSVPNRPIYSRISYLYQAAAYMSSSSSSSTRRDEEQVSPEVSREATTEASEHGTALPGKHIRLPGTDTAKRQAMSRRLLADLRSCSLKTQIRLSPSVKHTVCRYCDTLLVEGDTSTSVVENRSKGGKKPWADVLVVKCNTCGGLKRFPVQAPRQKRRPARETESKGGSGNTSVVPVQGG